jgi:hypothetical protein
MPTTLQTFLTRATAKAKDDLVTAFNRLPEDKRDWSPMGNARTALDMMAECAILNGSTADMIKAKAWTMGDDFSEYMNAKAELVKDSAKVLALLEENTARAIAAIGEARDGDLDIEIHMPWAPSSLAQVMAYPYWNMCYHEGQINYLASMLGCLE